METPLDRRMTWLNWSLSTDGGQRRWIERTKEKSINHRALILCEMMETRESFLTLCLLVKHCILSIHTRHGNEYFLFPVKTQFLYHPLAIAEQQEWENIQITRTRIKYSVPLHPIVISNRIYRNIGKSKCFFFFFWEISKEIKRSSSLC